MLDALATAFVPALLFLTQSMGALTSLIWTPQLHVSMNSRLI